MAPNTICDLKVTEHAPIQVGILDPRFSSDWLYLSFVNFHRYRTLDEMN